MDEIKINEIEEKEIKRDFRYINMIMCGIVIGMIIYDSIFLIQNFNLMKTDPLSYLEQKTGKSCQVVCTDDMGLVTKIYTTNESAFNPFSQYHLNLSKDNING